MKIEEKYFKKFESDNKEFVSECCIKVATFLSDAADKRNLNNMIAFHIISAIIVNTLVYFLHMYVKKEDHSSVANDILKCLVDFLKKTPKT